MSNAVEKFDRVELEIERDEIAKELVANEKEIRLLKIERTELEDRLDRLNRMLQEIING